MKKINGKGKMDKMKNLRLKLLLDYLNEDAGRGDITTRSLGITKRCRAKIIAKGNFVVAGISAISLLLEYHDIGFRIVKQDGKKCKNGEAVMNLEGDGATILKLERLILNIMGRMSGIATATRKIVDKISRAKLNCIVAATRKTTPGFRIFEKEAVFIGGGHPHRFDLAAAVLIKDNHLMFIKDPSEALGRAMAHKKGQASKTRGKKVPVEEQRLGSIEIEADTLGSARSAVKAGADVVMLDNMQPSRVARAYKELKAIRPGIIIEVSGGLTPDNVLKYARHADVVSLGWLTHSAPSADFSLKVTEVF
jgi:nicotinate-nucleotide pyrophosphorylase (carboxylating)